MQTPLEVEYKELVKQSAVEKRTANGGTNTASRRSERPLPEDVVTLSSTQPDVEQRPKLKPSQPVTPTEKQALYVPFSVYG
jgi:hypothetical protein